MRTETVEHRIYTFDELSDDSKSKAVARLSDINIDHEWWDGTYEDAKTIGIKISGFDTGRGGVIDIKLIDEPINICKAILEHHGETCETYKLAQANLSAFLAHRMIDGHYDELHDLIETFTKELGQAYLSMLRSEYEYLMSEESIIETIEANEYEFTEDGKIY